MKPENALKILEQFNDRQVVKILSVMPDKATGKILEQMTSGEGENPARAARIAEYLRLAIATKQDANT